MRKRFVIFGVTGFALAGLLSGCGSVGKKIAESAGGKNLGLDGYVMFGAVEMTDAETATPTGKLIIGRLTYKSRKVGIPADQKVPTTGYFKSTATKSLFGTEEKIVEYDFTAGSDADAAAARLALEKLRAEALAATSTPAATPTDTTGAEASK